MCYSGREELGYWFDLVSFCTGAGSHTAAIQSVVGKVVEPISLEIDGEVFNFRPLRSRHLLEHVTLAVDTQSSMMKIMIEMIHNDILI